MVESLTAYISDAGLLLGDRLPSERELSVDLGVSRPVLREALKHLSALGIVEAKTGSGTYVRRLVSPSDHHVVMQLENERLSLLRLLQLRRALESEAAALTALTASEDEIAELERLVDELEQAHAQQGKASKEDKAFHLALYRTSGNPLFEQVIAPIWDTMERLKLRPSQGVDIETLGHHRETVTCIRNRDADGARRTIQKLITLVEEDLSQEGPSATEDEL